MPEYLKVENHSDLVRDVNTGAILSQDSSSYQLYINNRNRAISEKQRIENLESELSDIKTLLNTLIGKLDVSKL